MPAGRIVAAGSVFFRSADNASSVAPGTLDARPRATHLRRSGSTATTRAGHRRARESSSAVLQKGFIGVGKGLGDECVELFSLLGVEIIGVAADLSPPDLERVAVFGIAGGQSLALEGALLLHRFEVVEARPLDRNLHRLRIGLLPEKRKHLKVFRGSACIDS